MNTKVPPPSKVAKPKLEKPVAQRSAPAATQAPEHAETKPIQFKVTPEFHREFKAYAAERGVKMNTLFETMYRFYREHKG